MKKKSLLKRSLVLVIGVLMAATMLAGCGGSSESASADSGDMMDRVVSAGKLVVTMNTGNKPWTYKDGNDYDGMAVALIKGYCEEMGIECDIQPMKFESMIPALNEGKVDIICTNLSRTVPRSQTVMFTDSIGCDYGVVVVKKGTYKKLSEINNSKITITTEAGSVWEGLAADIFPDAKTSPVDTTPNSFQALKSGRADAVFTDGAIAREYVATDSSCEILSENAYTDTMAFAVDSNPGVVTFLNSFNSYMKNIKANGKYSELCEQYLGEEWVPDSTENSIR